MAAADLVRFGRMPTDESRLRRVLDEARETAIGLDRWMAALAEAEQAEDEASSEAVG
jgi:hypothetical protein